MLGDTFSQAYYTVYDYETEVIGFQGFVVDHLPVIEQKAPYQLIPTWGIVLLVLGGIGTVGGLIYCVVQKRRTRQLEKQLGFMHKMEEVDLDDY